MGHEGLALSASAAPASPAKKNTAALAPGFRFHPTDEELVSYYLKRKVCKKPFRFNAIGEVDIYKNEPWDLAAYSWMKTRDQEWYFFSALDKKYGNGARMNRATGKGYWKATGKDREIRRESQLIGMKKTLVFHSGRAPDGQRTNWVMHEYRLVEEELDKLGAGQDSYVLCRVFHKNNIGPPNGNRYAPFVEEEWDDGMAAFPGEDAADDVVAGDDACIERDDGERTCFERNGGERVCIERNGGKRFRTERNGEERSRVERNSGERIHIERSGGEKNHVERNGGERNHIERSGGERMRIERNGGERMHIEQDSQSINKEPLNINELPRDGQNELLVCKREGIDVCPSLCVLNTQAPLPLLQYKRRKQNDSGSNRSNGSDNSSGPGHDPSSSTTTTAETATMMATNSATTAAISALLEFSLMDSIEPGETPRVPQTSMFEADDFDSQMPPSCAKLIKDLKQQVHKVAVERETLKLEMMSAQAMINILHSRVDQLTRENEHLKRTNR